LSFSLLSSFPAIGKRPLAIYLDHGGSPQTNRDGAREYIEIRDLLTGLGWQSSCATSPDSLCYYWEPNALHTEEAWKARVYLFLQFLFPSVV
jgi:hypothetical protein